MTESNKRVVWLDAVRLAAMFMVVCCHSADPFNFYQGPPPANLDEIKWWGAFYGSLLRPCVPLFVMLTGALLLPVRKEASVFYKKRIGRVLWPFLIWSVLYNLFPWFTKLAGCPPEVILDFFPYSGEAAARQSLSVCLSNVSQVPLNFSPLAVHMWYIYMLIGLYLYLPVFSAWVEKASWRAKGWFLVAWAVTLLLPYYREYVSPYIWGACSWNEFQMLHYFAGFNGYLLLGHCLRHRSFPLRTVLGIGLPLFVAGWAVTFFGFRHISSLPSFTDEQLELYFYYCSPNVAVMTAVLFALISHVNVTSGPLVRLLSSLTACGFGIYMAHFFFTGPCVNLMRGVGLPLGLQIPAGGVAALAVSWILVALVRKAAGRRTRFLVG